MFKPKALKNFLSFLKTILIRFVDIVLQPIERCHRAKPEQP